MQYKTRFEIRVVTNEAGTEKRITNGIYPAPPEKFAK